MEAAIPSHFRLDQLQDICDYIDLRRLEVQRPFRHHGRHREVANWWRPGSYLRLAIVLLSCAILCSYDPLSPVDGPGASVGNSLLLQSEPYFAVWFGAELLVRAHHFGLWTCITEDWLGHKHGPGPWVLDFVLFLLDACLLLPSMRLSPFRSFRALRLIRVPPFIRESRRHAHNLRGALKPLSHVLLLTLVLLFILGGAAVQAWGGSIPVSEDAWLSLNNPGFASVPSAALNFWTAVTAEGWPMPMIQIMASWGHDGFVGAAWVLISALLYLGVYPFASAAVWGHLSVWSDPQLRRLQMEQYIVQHAHLLPMKGASEPKAKRYHVWKLTHALELATHGRVTDFDWPRVDWTAAGVKPVDVLSNDSGETSPSSATSEAVWLPSLHSALQSRCGTAISCCTTVGHMLACTLQHAGMDESWTTGIATAQLAFVIAFAVELALRVSAAGPAAAAREHMLWVEVFVLAVLLPVTVLDPAVQRVTSITTIDVSGIVDPSDPSATPASMAFRAWQGFVGLVVLRLARPWPSFNRVGLILANSAHSIRGCMMLLILWHWAMSAIGLHMLGGRLNGLFASGRLEDVPYPVFFRFDSFFDATVTVAGYPFMAACGLMSAAVAAVGPVIILYFLVLLIGSMFVMYNAVTTTVVNAVLDYEEHQQLVLQQQAAAQQAAQQQQAATDGSRKGIKGGASLSVVDATGGQPVQSPQPTSTSSGTVVAGSAVAASSGTPTASSHGSAPVVRFSEPSEDDNESPLPKHDASADAGGRTGTDPGPEQQRHEHQAAAHTSGHLLEHQPSDHNRSFVILKAEGRGAPSSLLLNLRAVHSAAAVELDADGDGDGAAGPPPGATPDTANRPAEPVQPEADNDADNDDRYEGAEATNAAGRPSVAQQPVPAPISAPARPHPAGLVRQGSRHGTEASLSTQEVGTDSRRDGVDSTAPTAGTGTPVVAALGHASPTAASTTPQASPHAAQTLPPLRIRAGPPTSPARSKAQSRSKQQRRSSALNRAVSEGAGAGRGPATGRSRALSEGGPGTGSRRGRARDTDPDDSSDDDSDDSDEDGAGDEGPGMARPELIIGETGRPTALRLPRDLSTFTSPQVGVMSAKSVSVGPWARTNTDRAITSPDDAGAAGAGASGAADNGSSFMGAGYGSVADFDISQDLEALADPSPVVLEILESGTVRLQLPDDSPTDDFSPIGVMPLRMQQPRASMPSGFQQSGTGQPTSPSNGAASFVSTFGAKDASGGSQQLSGSSGSTQPRLSLPHAQSVPPADADVGALSPTAQAEYGTVSPIWWVWTFFRLTCRSIVLHPAFERVVLLFILVSCLNIALDEPRLQACGRANDCSAKSQMPEVSHGDCAYLVPYLLSLDIIITAFFTCEAAARIAAFGLLRGRKAYLRSPWNWIDAVAVLSSIIGMGLDPRAFSTISGSSIDAHGSGLQAVRIIRALRVLRAFRTLARVPSLRIVVTTLIKALKVCAPYAVINMALAWALAVAGVRMFGGQMDQCNDPDMLRADECTGVWTPSGDACIMLPSVDAQEACAAGDASAVNYTLPRLWAPPVAFHFDDVGSAVWSVIWLGFMAVWPVVPARPAWARDAVDPAISGNMTTPSSTGSWPIELDPLSTAYMVTTQAALNLFTLQLFLIGLAMAYSDAQAEGWGAGLLTDEQEAWVRSTQKVLWAVPWGRPNPPTEPEAPQDIGTGQGQAGVASRSATASQASSSTTPAVAKDNSGSQQPATSAAPSWSQALRMRLSDGLSYGWYTLRMRCWAVAEADVFYWLTMAVVGAVVLGVGVYTDPQTPVPVGDGMLQYWDLATVQQALAAFLLLEAVVKVLGYGIRSYSSSHGYRLEAITTLACILSELPYPPEATAVGLVARLVRPTIILRLLSLPVFKPVQHLLRALVPCLPAVLNVLSLLAFLVFIGSCVGMNLVSGVRYSIDGWSVQPVVGYNYDSFGSAIVATVNLLLGDGLDMLTGFAVQPPYCVEDGPGANCGTGVGGLLLLTIIFLIAVCLLVPVIIVIIVDEYFSLLQARAVAATSPDGAAWIGLPEQVDSFKDAWALSDPAGTGTVSFEGLLKVLQELEVPLGVRPVGLPRTAAGGSSSSGLCRTETSSSASHRRPWYTSLVSMLPDWFIPQGSTQGRLQLLQARQLRAAAMKVLLDLRLPASPAGVGWQFHTVLHALVQRAQGERTPAIVLTAGGRARKKHKKKTASTRGDSSGVAGSTQPSDSPTGPSGAPSSPAVQPSSNRSAGAVSSESEDSPVVSPRLEALVVPLHSGEVRATRGPAVGSPWWALKRGVYTPMTTPRPQLRVGLPNVQMQEPWRRPTAAATPQPAIATATAQTSVRSPVGVSWLAGSPASPAAGVPVTGKDLRQTNTAEAGAGSAPSPMRSPVTLTTPMTVTSSALGAGTVTGSMATLPELDPATPAPVTTAEFAAGLLLRERFGVYVQRWRDAKRTGQA